MKPLLFCSLFTFFCKAAFSQNVGIGTNSPTDKLQVIGITRSDTFAIGTSAPRSPVSFAPTVGPKIALWDDGNPGGAPLQHWCTKRTTANTCL